MIPSSNAPLEHENLPGQHPVSLLLQIEVMSILEEDLGPPQLIVCLAKHLLADAGGGLATVNLVCRGTAVDEVSVPLHKLLEGMSDGVARSPDTDGLHHA